jgi:hypothetical protein
MVQFFYANDNKHKYVAVFNDGQSVRFGAFGYEDYTITNNKEQKKRYLNRHRKREDWNDPKTPGALSRWILWNKPTIEESIKDYIKKFHMELE